MIVFLDTNAYIGSNYIFDSNNFGALKKLITSYKVTLLYTSATVGEVKQHIRDDISAAVKKYNRILRKDMPVLNEEPIYNLKSLDENQVVNSVIDKLDELVGLDFVEQISLNPLDAEKLLDDYFNQTPPFESKKPNEFKDAIMINAIKRLQITTNQQICIVSNDEGFRKAFEDTEKFITFDFLGRFLKHYNESEAEILRIMEFISEVIYDGDFDEIIKKYLLDFDIDRDYYEEWECEDVEVDEIYCEILFVEEIEGKFRANITVKAELSIDITYRDEETSYYDKEEEAYLIENFIHAIEKHRATIEMKVTCDIEDNEKELSLKDFCIVEDKHLKYINLGEDTMVDSNEVENTLHEEPDLEYCNECGALLGRTANGACSDYEGNAICSNCAVTDSNGAICPGCGYKVPHEHMVSNFCNKCTLEYD